MLLRTVAKLRTQYREIDGRMARQTHGPTGRTLACRTRRKSLGVPKNYQRSEQDRHGGLSPINIYKQRVAPFPLISRKGLPRTLQVRYYSSGTISIRISSLQQRRHLGLANTSTSTAPCPGANQDADLTSRKRVRGAGLTPPKIVAQIFSTWPARHHFRCRSSRACRS